MSDRRHLNLARIPQVVTATATGKAALESPDWLQNKMALTFSNQTYNMQNLPANVFYMVVGSV